VSGAVMLDQVLVMQDLLGADTVRRALESLPPPLRDEWEGLLPVSWISVAATAAFIEAAAREADRSVDDLQREIARLGVERTLKTVWRILLRLTSDGALVKRTPMLYSKTYDRGQMSSRMTGPGQARIELEGWDGIPALEVLGLAVGIETVLRCAGRRDVACEGQPRANGASFVATWTP